MFRMANDFNLEVQDPKCEDVIVGDPNWFKGCCIFEIAEGAIRAVIIKYENVVFRRTESGMSTGDTQLNTSIGGEIEINLIFAM